MLCDVESNQPFNGPDVVEWNQVEPLVLQGLKALSLRRIDSSLVREAEVRQSQNRKDDREYGAELLVPSAEEYVGPPELGRARTEEVERHYALSRSPDPASGSRPRDPVADRESNLAGLPHQVLQAVVVRALVSCRG